jgi:hypothetical protein
MNGTDRGSPPPQPVRFELSIRSDRPHPRRTATARPRDVPLGAPRHGNASRHRDCGAGRCGSWKRIVHSVPPVLEVEVRWCTTSGYLCASAIPNGAPSDWASTPTGAEPRGSVPPPPRLPRRRRLRVRRGPPEPGAVRREQGEARRLGDRSRQGSRRPGPGAVQQNGDRVRLRPRGPSRSGCGHQRAGMFRSWPAGIRFAVHPWPPACGSYPSEVMTSRSRGIRCSRLCANLPATYRAASGPRPGSVGVTVNTTR